MLPVAKVNGDINDFIKDIFDGGCPAVVIEDGEISYIIRNKSGNVDEAAPYSTIKKVQQGDIVHNYFCGVDKNKFDKIVKKLGKSKRIVDMTKWFNK